MIKRFIKNKIVYISALVLVVAACNNRIEIKPWDIVKADTITTLSGLKYIWVYQNPDTSIAKANIGTVVQVHYTGFLTNGKIFDSSIKRDIPFSFMLGTGMVIKGWDEGIALMRKGDKIRLIIPPSLGYGGKQTGEIPPYSTLLFDVELIDMK